MAEILIKALDTPTWADLIITNPHKAEMCYRKGDIVEIREDGRIIGPNWEQSLEKLPDFVIIRIPGVSKNQIREYKDTWKRGINYEVVSHNEITDEYQIQVEAVEQSVSGFEHINREKIKDWLQRRNCTVLDHGPTWVLFSFTPYEGFTAQKLRNNAESNIGEDIKRRKWRISDAEVDAIAAQGGVIELSLGQVRQRLISKWDTTDGY